MVARCSNPVRRIPLNTRGRDFVVGDIHGCYAQVLRAMDGVKFDTSIDRLFCVGDLIDRGPDSDLCLDFLGMPYVFAALGNHEDMVLELYEDGEPHPATLRYVTKHNGFGWWNGASDRVKADCIAAFRKLPIAMEVETRRGTIGIVHADVPASMDWPTFLEGLEEGDETVMKVALWGRDRLHAQDLCGVEGIGRVFVGHTPLRHATRIGNVYAIDTGSVFGVMGSEGYLTFADACAQTNAFTTHASMMAPEGLVSVLSSARTEAPFTNLLGR